MQSLQSSVQLESSSIPYGAEFIFILENHPLYSSIKEAKSTYEQSQQTSFNFDQHLIQDRRPPHANLVFEQCLSSTNADTVPSIANEKVICRDLGKYI